MTSWLFLIRKLSSKSNGQNELEQDRPSLINLVRGGDLNDRLSIMSAHQLIQARSIKKEKRKRKFCRNAKWVE